jgi:hypothetical protein
MKADKTSKKPSVNKSLSKGNNKKGLKEFVRLRNTETVQLLMHKARIKSGKDGDTSVIKHALTEYISN